MKTRYLIVLMVLFLFAILLARYFLVNSKSNEYIFSVSETFTNDSVSPHIFITFVTKESFGCSNFRINHEISISENSIKTKLDGIDKSGVCLTAFGPAKFTEELPITIGVYTLEIQSGFISDKYEVKVSSQFIEILDSNVVSQISHPLKTKVTRFPKGIWKADCSYNADYRYIPSDVGEYCKKFYDKLKTIATPYIETESGRIPKTQFFIYLQDESVLKAISSQFKREGFYIEIYRPFPDTKIEIEYQ